MQRLVAQDAFSRPHHLTVVDANSAGTDEPLKEDIRLLGRLLGDVLRDHPRRSQLGRESLFLLLAAGEHRRGPAPHPDPLNHLQVELIQRHRMLAGEPNQIDERAHRGIHLSINGVAAGLRNTG